MGGKPNLMNVKTKNPVPGCFKFFFKRQLFFSFILLLWYTDGYTQTVADFTISKRSGCVPLSNVSFIETCTGGTVVQRDWNFGNGTIISNGNASVSANYVTAQKFYITLTVTFSNGDIRNKTDSITVFAAPVLAINGSDVFCIKANNKLQYTGTVASQDAVVRYKWMIDADSVANTRDLNYSYRIPGTHYLYLVVTTASGCQYTVAKRVVVDYMATWFTVSAGRLCGSGDVTFKNASINIYPIAGYTWDFGDGSTYSGVQQNHTYTTPGNYTVKLTAVSVTGCTDSTVFKDSIKVLNMPAAVINGADVVCLTPSSTLQYSGTITSVDPVRIFKWSVDGKIAANAAALSYNYRIPGSHLLTYTIKSVKGCETSVSKTILIDSVKAGFSVSNASLCGSGTAVFNNLTKNYSPVNNYTWSFGDGNSSAAAAPSNDYNAEGLYTVKLFAQTANGCADSSTMVNAVKVYNVPVASIAGKDVVCLTPSSLLAYTGNIISKDAATYQWTVGAVNAAATPNLLYNYRVPGWHTIGLKITTVNGCSFFTSKEIMIDSVKVRAAPLTSSFCGEGIVNFSNLSSSAFGATVYQWNFGDNNFYTGFQNNHQYKAAGLYDVKLAAVTENGCTDSVLLAAAVHIFKQPVISIAGDSIHCSPGRYTYTSSTNVIESIDRYQWYINSIAAGNNADLIYYFKSGVYTISLKVTTLNGCTDSVSRQIVIDDVRANFSISQSKFCSDTALVVFDNLSATAFSGTVYQWNFGDNEFSIEVNPVHLYQQRGIYTIALSAISQTGCADTFLLKNGVQIFKQPDAGIAGKLIYCSTGRYTYLHTGAGNDPGLAYQWKVNNTNTTNTPDLLYNFATAGNYNIALKVTSPDGCTADSSITVIVDTLRIKFAQDKTEICGNNGTVKFTNLTSTAFAGINYLWDFGDSQQSVQASPVHFYGITGRFSASLKATTVNGCTQKITAADTLKIFSVSAAIDGASSACFQKSLLHRAKVFTLDNVTAYTWKQNNLPISVADTLRTDFSSAGSYTIQLMVKTAMGCTDSIQKNITIHALPIPAVSADTTICRGSIIQLRSNDGIKYQWTPAVNIRNSATASPLVDPIATTVYRVTVTNQYGCVQNDSVTVTADQPTGLKITSDKSICIGEKVALRAAATTASVKWFNAEGLSDTGIPNPVAQPVKTTTYGVVAYSSNVCKNDTGFVTISVGYIPVVDAGPNKTVEANELVQLNAKAAAADITSYTWSEAAGLSCTACTNPSFTAVKDVVYTFTVKTLYGCVARDEVKCTVLPAKPALLMPTAFTPNNDGLNDRFYVKGYGLVTVKHMLIFNKWGQKVFEKFNVPANDPAYGWSAETNGEPTGNSAVFVYQITAITHNGTELHLKGTVTVLR